MGNFECVSNLLSQIIQLKIFLLIITVKNQHLPISVDNRFVFDKLAHINKMEIGHDSRGKGFKDNSC
jgi:hypothetical protein